MRTAISHIRLLSFMFILALLGGYVYLQTAKLLEKATVTITFPQDGAVVYDPVLEIAGYALHANNLKINGSSILMDKLGTFSFPTVLAEGYNSIVVTWNNRFQAKTKRVYHVMYVSDKS